jgi:hypothetical protein
MVFCLHCGKTIEPGSAFCPHCGGQVTSSLPDSENEIINEEEYRAFLGNKADHYLRKFRFFGVRGTNSFAVTWNWPAFFLGFIWMLYRKMYLWALVSFVIALTPVAFPLTMIGWGIVGNYLYYSHARKKILDYRSLQSQTSTALTLYDLGGVNRWVWFVGFILLIFLLFIAVLGFFLFLHFLGNTGFYRPQIVEI